MERLEDMMDSCLWEFVQIYAQDADRACDLLQMIGYGFQNANLADEVDVLNGSPVIDVIMSWMPDHNSQEHTEMAVWSLNEILRGLDRTGGTDTIDDILDRDVVPRIFACLSMVSEEKRYYVVHLASYVARLDRRHRDSIFRGIALADVEMWMSPESGERMRSAGAELIMNLTHIDGLLDDDTGFGDWIIEYFLNGFRNFDEHTLEFLLIAVGGLAHDYEMLCERLFKRNFEGAIEQILERERESDSVAIIKSTFYILIRLTRDKPERIGYEPELMMHYATHRNETVSFRALDNIAALLKHTEHISAFAGKQSVFTGMLSILEEGAYEARMLACKCVVRMLSPANNGSGAGMAAVHLAQLGFIPAMFTIFEAMESERIRLKIICAFLYMLDLDQSPTGNVVFTAFQKCETMKWLYEMSNTPMSEEVSGQLLCLRDHLIRVEQNTTH